MMAIIIGLAVTGFLLSCYGRWVELKLATQKEYSPSCDISNRFSCSKSFKSPYAKIFFGIPNTILGMLFYTALAVAAFLSLSFLVWLLAVAGVFASIVFVYILLVKIDSWCPICLCVYIVNALIMYCAYYLY